MQSYLSEVNISGQDLAIWWTKNLIILAIMVTVFFTVKSLLTLDTRCAPASFEGRTVTNCIQK